MNFLSWFGVSAKKHRSAQGFQPKQTLGQWRQETFVPEDLITPGTLVDSAHPLVVDFQTPPLPEVHLPTDPTHVTDLSHPDPTTPVDTTHAPVVDSIHPTDVADVPPTHHLDPLPFHTDASTIAATPDPYTSGVFTVDAKGQVTIDYLFNGGKYNGQLAIFSLSGMEHFTPGSQEFIQEAAHRAFGIRTKADGIHQTHQFMQLALRVQGIGRRR